MPPVLAAMPAAKLLTPTLPISGSVSIFGASIAWAVTLTEPPVAPTWAYWPMLAVVSSPL